jgi:L-threonylcarbamoyladenylate synthase
VEVVRVTPDDPEAEVLARATEVLRDGQLLIYPTDTLYALGCRARDRAAALRVRQAKGREDAKPLPLVAADLAQVAELCMPPSAVPALARRFWPGALTLVLPARGGVAPELTAGGDSLAIRVPASSLVRELCRRVGPLVSTSANRAGEQAPRTCQAAVTAVGSAAALALDGGAGGELASTIVDLIGPRPCLLRAGAVAWAEVEATLRGSGA